jgi:selenide, water dikinase
MPDDAAVWQIDDENCLIATIDFFTPVVDDPYDYGAIAAANSLSDVYAMGGMPFMALNVAALPPDLPEEISREILRGGAEKVFEAGAVVAGGHTIQDKEPKFGLVALGMVRSDSLMTKQAVRPGDRLVLTKPIGFGVLTTAIKQEKANPEEIAEVVRWMSTLNRNAAQLAVELGLKAATDITGFGLLGHGLEMAQASEVKFEIQFDQVPVLEPAQNHARERVFAGGAFDNQSYFGKDVTFTRELEEHEQLILFDPQTSGGLLLAVPPEKLADFEGKAQELSQPYWVIGKVYKGEGLEIV